MLWHFVNQQLVNEITIFSDSAISEGCILPSISSSIDSLMIDYWTHVFFCRRILCSILLMKTLLKTVCKTVCCFFWIMFENILCCIDYFYFFLHIENSFYIFQFSVSVSVVDQIANLCLKIQLLHINGSNIMYILEENN